MICKEVSLISPWQPRMSAIGAPCERGTEVGQGFSALQARGVVAFTPLRLPTGTGRPDVLGMKRRV